jgi:hypothetical protein
MNPPRDTKLLIVQRVNMQFNGLVSNTLPA